MEKLHVSTNRLLVSPMSWNGSVQNRCSPCIHAWRVANYNLSLNFSGTEGSLEKVFPPYTWCSKLYLMLSYRATFFSYCPLFNGFPLALFLSVHDENRFGCFNTTFQFCSMRDYSLGDSFGGTAINSV